VTVAWDFGDGNDASAPIEETVQHTYAAPGTFAVSATMPDGQVLGTEVEANNVFPTILVPRLGEGPEMFTEYMEVGFITAPPHPLRSGMAGLIVPLTRRLEVGSLVRAEDIHTAFITTESRPDVATMWVETDGGVAGVLNPDANGTFATFLTGFGPGEHVITFTLRDDQEQTVGSGTLRFATVPLGTFDFDSVEPDAFTVAGPTLSEDLTVTIRGSGLPSSLISYSLRNETALEHAAIAEVVSESEVVATLLPAGQHVGEPGTTNWALGLANNEAASTLPPIPVTVTE
jgi:PKD repeat protein